MRELIVGSRGSALALKQTVMVCDALRALDSTLRLRVERIATTGDVRPDLPLSQLGRGVFVTEIETALRAGRINLAVHSAKDLPSTLSSDLTLAAFLPREDARDVLISRAGLLRDLPPGARVGTSSPRRTCLIRAARPDVEPRDVRGNVDTRLRKLAMGEFDALVLAAAGLIRLGRATEITEWLDVDTFIPSVGQGALAIEVRACDTEIVKLLGRLDDRATRTAISAERAFLAELGAGCQAAAAAHATLRGDRLHLGAFIGAADGRQVRLRRESDGEDPERLGALAARELLRGGGAVFLAPRESPLAGLRVAITRAADRSTELMTLLEAHGARPMVCPTIDIEPVEDSAPLDAALRDLQDVDWLVFTSGNAVRVIADRLKALGLFLPDTVRLAAVGGTTSALAAELLRRADYVPAITSAKALAQELPVQAGNVVLFARGNLAGDSLPSQLRERGVRVRDLVVYHTRPAAGAAMLAAHVRTHEWDAVIFASPSSIEFCTDLPAALDATSESRPIIACIGETTASAARALGVTVDVVADTQSVGGIVEALSRAVGGRLPAAVHIS